MEQLKEKSYFFFFFCRPKNSFSYMFIPSIVQSTLKPRSRRRPWGGSRRPGWRLSSAYGGPRAAAGPKGIARAMGIRERRVARARRRCRQSPSPFTLFVEPPWSRALSLTSVLNFYLAGEAEGVGERRRRGRRGRARELQGQTRAREWGSRARRGNSFLLLSHSLS